MADEATEQSAPETEAKPSKKLLIVVAAVMVLEGLAVAGFMMLTGGPADASAAGVQGADLAEQEETVELDLVTGRFQNMDGERIWLCSTEIKLKVREKHREFVEAELTERAGEIREGINLIFRRAQPSHLREPALETLNRQVTALMADILGEHPDGSARFERVLIPKCEVLPGN